MVTAERIATRRELIAGSTDLTALARHVAARNAPVVERLPAIPRLKALLSVDGGRCAEDGRPLVFDPWSPDEHGCPQCGRRYRGDRHHRAWAKLQHLWLGERAVELATLAALGQEPAGAASRAAEILRAYGERYFQYPNRDNVLGPSRLFFSTYLESIWVLNYLAAATLLRDADLLNDATARAVHDVADEAANLIGEYDEGFSNRQTWNNAALAAIAVWFEDEDLARRAIQGDTGLIAHLRGYRDDGLWYEGENYHLFALRGLLIGAGWATQAGMDFWAEPTLAAVLGRALRAPTLTALPDFTFPARKDARFGVSLAQPMYLESWEVGLARLGNDTELAPWLRALYGRPPVMQEVFDSYLHDAPIGSAPVANARGRLSWWSLLEMTPELPVSDTEWAPASVFMPGQGLGVLRTGGRYVGLECGSAGGGHGHPDRLNLILHADGVYWLPDFGTGSYVTRDLFWYRSTLAHNAPRQNGTSQPASDAQGEAFDEREGWGWVRGRFGNVTRTVLVGDHYLLDVLEQSGQEEQTLELPWHFAGRGDVQGGAWEDGALDDEFLRDVVQLKRAAPGEIVLELVSDHQALTAHFVFTGELLRAEAAGRPGGPAERFYIQRARGRNLRFVTVIEFGTPGRVVRAVRARGDLVEIETPDGLHRHRYTGRGWEITAPSGPVTLTAHAVTSPRLDPLLSLEPPTRATGTAWRVEAPPRLDGTLDGFDAAEPLRLELEDQYRRSEEAYAGPEDFAARCIANWDDEALYLAIEVTKADAWFRPKDAAPKLLDNEPDDIHSDGVQVYLGPQGAADDGWVGVLVVPEPQSSRLRIQPVSDGPREAVTAHGAWRATDTGYCITLAIQWPEGLVTHAGGRLSFDLIVNEMQADRERRVGQLVWSGGNGWVWLMGDRQDPNRFGILELVG